MEEYFRMDAKKPKKKDVSSLLREIDALDAVVLPSAIQKSVEKKSEKAQQYDDESDDSWLDTIVSFDAPKPKKKKKKKKEFKGFTVEEKEKAEKKKKKGGPKDYRKEFTTELNTLQNLQVEQTRFTESLQKKYDDMEKSKASTKGIGKFTTDLISGITQARSTGLQIVKEMINVKKTIADLNMKEKKENNVGAGETDNVAYASAYLNQVMKGGRANLVNSAGGYDYPSSDEDEDSLLDSISENLSGTTRPEEVEKYLKYENENVEIYIEMSTDDHDEYEFVAINKDGKRLDDYPLPMKTKLTINESTSRATDIYGQKFNVHFY